SIQPQGIENLVLQRGKEVLAMVEKELPQLKTIRYSDHDLDEFYQAVGRFQPEEMPRFLSELKANGQIQNEQYERMIEKYHIQRETPKINVLVERRVDHSFAFLEACLKKHMQKGSRFSCFSNDPTSKYENPQFFEQIITNSDLDYQEKLIPVTVPETCEYYKHKEALVILIEKAT
ncbi:MAG TPA: hypothetical protein VLG76_01760, partial [Rhabdochlamydiaceae bacterium]|nr:hypothetical protein [Rhabdochlamydiaceae bacterium]